jgi:hypothetical protein
MAGLAIRLLHNLHWQDVIDILFLTAILSVAYRLIRRTVAVQVEAYVELPRNAFGSRNYRVRTRAPAEAA